MKHRADDGSVLVLIIGLLAVVLSLIAVVTDLSALFLARRSLAAIADGAALAGSQALDEEAFYTGAADPGRLPLDPMLARAEVADYVARSRVAGRQVGVRSAGVAEGRVDVTVTVGVDLPFRRFLAGAAAVPLTATATAESPLG